MKHPVRIVGGGMTGLTLGYRLSKAGIPVVVHERDPYLGGLSAEGALDGIPVERFYHCVLPSDGALLGLFAELGLAGEVGWTRTRTGFFWNSRLLEMTSTADLLRFPALGFTDRIRLGWTIGWCGLNRRWERLDNEPVSSFLRRHGGQKVFREIWEPLLLAKLGPNYDRFAASYIWATVARMLSARKARGRSEKLGFVRGRYGVVFRQLRAAIERSGGRVDVGQQVLAVEKLSSFRDGWHVRTADAALAASAVVLTVPAPSASHLVTGLAPETRARLEAVDYLGVICDVLLLDRPFSPYYILNQTDRSLPITGVIEFSNLAGKDEFGGRSLVYVPRYRDQGSPAWDWTDATVHAETIEGLRTIDPSFDPGRILAWQVNRARYVQPVNHQRRGRLLPPSVLDRGLLFIATAHIHPWPIFNDEVVRLVDRMLPQVVAEFDGCP
jgi:protoporphyrinogen oxidase